MHSAFYKPWQDIGRATLLRRLDIQAVRSHSPTKQSSRAQSEWNLEWELPMNISGNPVGIGGHWPVCLHGIKAS